jgi:hypothetical protein
LHYGLAGSTIARHLRDLMDKCQQRARTNRIKNLHLIVGWKTCSNISAILDTWRETGSQFVGCERRSRLNCTTDNTGRWPALTDKKQENIAAKLETQQLCHQRRHFDVTVVEKRRKVTRTKLQPKLAKLRVVIAAMLVSSAAKSAPCQVRSAQLAVNVAGVREGWAGMARQTSQGGGQNLRKDVRHVKMILILQVLA